MASRTSDASLSLTNSVLNDDDQSTQHQNESDSELPSNNPRRSSNTTENDNNAETDVRNIPIKELLSRKRRRGMKSMPSTVKRLAERKRKRLEKKNSNATQPEIGEEGDQQNNDDANPPDTTSPNPPETTSTPDAQTDPNDGAAENGPSTTDHESNKDADGVEGENGEVVAPQVKIDENGNIIIDQSSLVVSANNATDDASHIVNTVEHTPLGNHITSMSFKKRESSVKWSITETDKFYDALRSFGTDFSLMTHLFSNRSRRQLKHKFKKEERDSPKRIDESLNAPRIPIPANLPLMSSGNPEPALNNGPQPGDSTHPNGVVEATTNKADQAVNGTTTRRQGNAEGHGEEGTGDPLSTGEKEATVQDEIVGRVSDDEDAMLDDYDAAADGFDDGAGIGVGNEDSESDDD